ncbi:hypothetical protein OV079_42010 [Nannocystis pusilla]|uniref:Uncharacterized protein n=1 Tax=Nannocystis pusilla TaxID=889268 RepID=A0A9X3J3E9_9BACT|nr:hypothetical protein [Nannocystis pusilla]MCY1012013.1 hypothetical protein [Nannocystis pusilla]
MLLAGAGAAALGDRFRAPRKYVLRDMLLAGPSRASGKYVLGDRLLIGAAGLGDRFRAL